jgi:hypothetical protein
VNGSVLRAYVDHVKQLGLMDEVRARLSAEALQKVDKPPLAISWFDSRLSNEITQVVYDLRGRDAVREMGRVITSQSIARVLRPLVASSMSLFGTTPATLLSRLETFSSLMVRNADFSWTPKDERSGTMTLSHGVPLPDAAYALWEGVFLYMFELAQSPTGHVGQTRLANEGRQGSVDIGW